MFEPDRIALNAVFQGLGCANAQFCPQIPPNAVCPSLGKAFGKIDRLRCNAQGRVSQVAVFGTEVALRGTISSKINDLDALEWFEVFFAPGVRGQMPTLTKLQRLTVLDLSDCGLQGEIPPELGELQSLTDLFLNGNAFTGQIPEGLTRGKLDYLWLFGNRLEGPVPEFPSLTNCTLQKNEPDETNCFSECPQACCESARRCPSALTRATTTTTVTTSISTTSTTSIQNRATPVPQIVVTPTPQKVLPPELPPTMTKAPGQDNTDVKSTPGMSGTMPSDQSGITLILVAVVLAFCLCAVLLVLFIMRQRSRIREARDAEITVAVSSRMPELLENDVTPSTYARLPEPTGVQPVYPAPTFGSALSPTLDRPLPNGPPPPRFYADGTADL